MPNDVIAAQSPIGREVDVMLWIDVGQDPDMNKVHDVFSRYGLGKGFRVDSRDPKTAEQRDGDYFEGILEIKGEAAVHMPLNDLFNLPNVLADECPAYVGIRVTSIDDARDSLIHTREPDKEAKKGPARNRAEMLGRQADAFRKECGLQIQP